MYIIFFKFFIRKI